MQKDDKGAEALKEKLDRLTEPEKRLALAYIKEIEAGAVLKDRKPKRANARNL